MRSQPIYLQDKEVKIRYARAFPSSGHMRHKPIMKPTENIYFVYYGSYLQEALAQVALDVPYNEIHFRKYAFLWNTACHCYLLCA